jgi:hypothetical protein
MKNVLYLLILFSMTGILHSVVAFDAAVNSGDISNTTSGSWSHTVTGNNTYIVLGLAGWDSADELSGVTATYAGESLTFLGGRTSAGSDNSILLGASGANTGSNTLSYSNVPSGYAELGGGSVSMTGVDQTNSEGTLVNDPDEGNQPSVDIEMTTGDLGVDILYDGGSGNEENFPDVGTGGTERINTTGPSATKHMMMATEDGDGTVTMDWSEPTGEYDVSYTAIPILQFIGSPESIYRSGTFRGGIYR